MVTKDLNILKAYKIKVKMGLKKDFGELKVTVIK